MAIPLTAREPVEFTPQDLPPALQGLDPEDETKHKFRILIRVPTYQERDLYQAALVRAGIQVVTKQQIREISLAGVNAMFPEDERGEKQEMLRELWQLQDDQQDIQAKGIEILREEMEKASAAKRPVDLEEVKRRQAEIVPDVVMEDSRRIEAAALSQRIIALYAPLGEIVAGLADQDAKRAWLNARMYIVGWKGLADEPDPPGPAGLKNHEIEYLRSRIGGDAWSDVSEFITAMNLIDEDEEKNLASLFADMSAPIGSTPPESTASSDDGNSTAGPSTTTPESESAKTIKSSSSSTSRSGTRTADPKPGLTAEQSSSSPSN